MTPTQLPVTRHTAGFTLVELMVAMVIGLIAAIGLATLFSGTSRSSKLQEGLARLQENGRYAALRIEDDLRMAGAQYCSNRSGKKFVGPAAPMWRDRTPFVYAANLNLPDAGGMQSVDPLTGGRSNAAATSAYALSPRFFMQGYSCTSGSTCTPALWNSSMFPEAGLVAGRRVPNSDILTVRYQRGSGWPISGEGDCDTTGGSVTLAPQTGDDPVNFVPATAQLALISDCQSPIIVPITNISSNTLTVGARVSSSSKPICAADATRDTRVFNFSRDFVTVTYYLAFRADDNPDARPNAGSDRLVPVLIRRENGVEQELVRGIDRLDFRYGVRDNGGDMRFLTAAQVDNRLGGTIACAPKPENVPPAGPAVMEPGCLWRTVQRIEAYMLVNSGDEVPALDAISRSYRYMGTQYSPGDTATLPSGLAAHSYPRREFIAHATSRNKSP